MTTNWNVKIGNNLTDILHQCELHKMMYRQGASNSELRPQQRLNSEEELDKNAISEILRKTAEDEASG